MEQIRQKVICFNISCRLPLCPAIFGSLGRPAIPQLLGCDVARLDPCTRFHSRAAKWAYVVTLFLKFSVGFHGLAGDSDSLKWSTRTFQEFKQISAPHFKQFQAQGLKEKPKPKIGPWEGEAACPENRNPIRCSLFLLFSSFSFRVFFLGGRGIFYSATVQRKGHLKMRNYADRRLGGCIPSMELFPSFATDNPSGSQAGTKALGGLRWEASPGFTLKGASLVSRKLQSREIYVFQEACPC